MSYDPWIGVDLDGTLAEYHGWVEVPGTKLGMIGPPVKAMLERVLGWLAESKRVKIFTARAMNPDERDQVLVWLELHGLPPLEVTCVKDHGMIELWDDRAVRVVRNLGQPCC